jgi:hypothetical protein
MGERDHLRGTSSDRSRELQPQLLQGEAPAQAERQVEWLRGRLRAPLRSS